MKLLSKISPDFIALSVSCLIISGFSAMLYAEFSKKITIKNAKKIGTITFKKKVAQRKYKGQVIWEDIEQNSPVYNNDSLRTSEFSEALILLHDKTRIDIKENSMLVLNQEKNMVNISFEHGSISARRSGTSDSAISKINIRSQDATISIEKSDINLSTADGTGLNLTVDEGSAQVKTKTGEDVVSKNQQAIVNNNKTDISRLQVQLESPKPDAIIIANDKKIAIDFLWKPLPGPSKVTFELARDSHYRSIIARQEAVKNSFALSLDSGTYYWRVAALDVKTGKVELSSSRKMLVVNDKPVRLFHPANNQKIYYSSTNALINFNWGKNEIASGYIVEIAKDNQFKNIVKTIHTALANISISDFSIDNYFWRIKTKVNIPGVNYQGQSQVNNFSIVKKREVLPPVLYSPAHNKTYGLSYFKRFIFSWQAESGINQYEITIARDPLFNSIVVKELANQNFYYLNKELPQGTYYWKVKAIALDSLTKTSPTGIFILAPGKNIDLLKPLNNAVFTLKNNENLRTAFFSWSKSAFGNEYIIELAKDKSFLEKHESRVATTNYMSIDNLEPGMYYWKVKVIDQSRSVITVSTVAVFEIVRKSIMTTQVNNQGTGQKKPVDSKTMLTIVSPVAAGSIYLNNSYMGRGKISALVRPGTKQTIVVKAQDYYDYVTTMTLEAGEKKELVASLLKKKLLNRVRWQKYLNAAIMSKPQVYDDKIITATEDGYLFALNNAGWIVWKTKINNSLRSTPALHGDAAFLVNVDGELISVNLGNGKINWTRKINGPLLFGAQPLVLDEKIYMATSLGRLYAFNQKTGDVLWERDCNAGVFSSITHYKKLLYVGTDMSRIFGYDKKDGDDDWKFKVDDRIISSSPKIYQDKLYVGSTGGTLYSIDIKEDELKWKFHIEKPIFSTVSFHGDLLFFGGNDKYVYALNVNDGKMIWKYLTESNVVTEPGISQDRLYVASGNVISVLELDSGKLIWNYQFPDEINTPPTAIGDEICLGLKNGNLVILRNELRSWVKIK